MASTWRAREKANSKGNRQALVFLDPRSLAPFSHSCYQWPSLPLFASPPMPRYLRIYVAVAAFALLAAAHYTLHPFHRKEHSPPGAGVFDGEDGQRAGSAGVVVDRKGLVSYSLGHAGHPVEMLIERGKKLAEDMERRIASVMSVKHSAKDYVLSFGMRPPRGFDAWYVAAHSSLSFLSTCR